MQTEICQCIPRMAREPEHSKHLLSSIKAARANNLSQTGCNGPRGGIETHPQGLKCWTCGETVDATTCDNFPYYSKDGINDEEELSSQNVLSNGNDQVTSANEPVITHPNKWSKECLKNDMYCVIQYIVDQNGKNRKYSIDYWYLFDIPVLLISD